MHGLHLSTGEALSELLLLDWVQGPPSPIRGLGERTSTARMPDRAPGAGEQYPLPRGHGGVHRLQVLRGRLQRAERQPGGDQLAARRRDRRRMVSRGQPVVSVDGLQSLPRADVSGGLPGRRLYQGSDHWHRASQRRRLHRLSVLHVELFVRRPAVQPRARRGGKVRHVSWPALARPGTCVRQRLPGGGARDRDCERRRVARIG